MDKSGRMQIVFCLFEMRQRDKIGALIRRWTDGATKDSTYRFSSSSSAENGLDGICPTNWHIRCSPDKGKKRGAAAACSDHITSSLSPLHPHTCATPLEEKDDERKQEELDKRVPSCLLDPRPFFV